MTITEKVAYLKGLLEAAGAIAAVSAAPACFMIFIHSTDANRYNSNQNSNYKNISHSICLLIP